MNHSPGGALCVLTLTGLLTLAAGSTFAGSASAGAEAPGRPVPTATVPPRSQPEISLDVSRYWLAIGVNGGLDWPPSHVVLLNCDPSVLPMAPREVCVRLASVNGDLGRLSAPPATCTLEYKPSLGWSMGRWGGRPVGSARVFDNPCQLRSTLKGIVSPAFAMVAPGPVLGVEQPRSRVKRVDS